jgi:hypothetical protein
MYRANPTPGPRAGKSAAKSARIDAANPGASFGDRTACIEMETGYTIVARKWHTMWAARPLGLQAGNAPSCFEQVGGVTCASCLTDRVGRPKDGPFRAGRDRGKTAGRRGRFRVRPGEALPGTRIAGLRPGFTLSLSNP